MMLVIKSIQVIGFALSENLMHDRMTCRCRCHDDPSIKHLIACCSGSFKISEHALREIIEATVGDALSRQRMDAEAQRQNAIQRDIEAKIQASDVNAGNKKDKFATEAGNDPTNTGAPVRGVNPTTQSDQHTNIAPQVATPQMIDADAIIDKFNIIRSGRSLNDRDIRDLMKKYFGSLAPQQLQAIFSVLQKIGSIVASPQVDANRLKAPPEEPTAIKNARLAMLRKKYDTEHSKTDALMTQAQSVDVPSTDEEAETEENEEDNSPPIRVGSRTAESVKLKMKLLLQE
jgi:hypothetical protein